MKKQSAYERTKRFRRAKQLRKEEGHSPLYIREREEWDANEINTPKITTQHTTPEPLELPIISKQVLIYEMEKANYTDLDKKEQTGLSWDEIKRLKTGGKREYERIIKEYLDKWYWVIFQEGYEKGLEENEG